MDKSTKVPPPDALRLKIKSGIDAFGNGETIIPIGKSPFAIGRWVGCDAVLSPPWILQKHCEITLGNGQIRIVDTGSTNKTFVNGSEVAGSGHTLNHMDEIQLAYDPGVTLVFLVSTEFVPKKTFDMDVLKREVKVRGEVKDLTALEFNILEHLYSHKGKWCSNTSIIKSAWDTDVIEADMEVLHKHISNLRKKIEPDPSNHRLVLNKKGFGYMFQD